MKLFTMESEQNNYAAEIEAIQAEKEAAISSLVTAKDDLVKAKDAIFYTIGTETYAQFSAGSNECELMSHFLQIKNIEEQVLATDEKMAEIAQHYDAEIAILQTKAATPAAPIPPVVADFPEIPVMEEPAAPVVEEFPEIPPMAEPMPPMVEDFPEIPPIVQSKVDDFHVTIPESFNSFCDNCGKMLGEKDIFCQFCGTRTIK